MMFLLDLQKEIPDCAWIGLFAFLCHSITNSQSQLPQSTSAPTKHKHQRTGKMKIFLTTVLLVSHGLSVASNTMLRTRVSQPSCLGTCQVDLGVSTCSEAIEKYDFSGDCCSLQERFRQGGNCTLVSTTECYYVEKGHDGCQPAEGTSQVICVGVPGVVVKAGNSAFGLNLTQPCPESEIDIPEPTVTDMGVVVVPPEDTSESGIGFDKPEPASVIASLEPRETEESNNGGVVFLSDDEEAEMIPRASGASVRLVISKLLYFATVGCTLIIGSF